jgi:hypothetical protein
MALLLTSVFGVTGCGSDDDVQAESRVKNVAPEASGVSNAPSKADCDRIDRLDEINSENLRKYKIWGAKRWGSESDRVAAELWTQAELASDFLEILDLYDSIEVEKVFNRLRMGYYDDRDVFIRKLVDMPKWEIYRYSQERIRLIRGLTIFTSTKYPYFEGLVGLMKRVTSLNLNGLLDRCGEAVVEQFRTDLALFRVAQSGRNDQSLTEEQRQGHRDDYESAWKVKTKSAAAAIEVANERGFNLDNPDALDESFLRNWDTPTTVPPATVPPTTVPPVPTYNCIDDDEGVKRPFEPVVEQFRTDLALFRVAQSGRNDQSLTEEQRQGHRDNSASAYDVKTKSAAAAIEVANERGFNLDNPDALDESFLRNWDSAICGDASCKTVPPAPGASGVSNVPSETYVLDLVFLDSFEALYGPRERPHTSLTRLDGLNSSSELVWLMSDPEFRDLVDSRLSGRRGSRDESWDPRLEEALRDLDHIMMIRLDRLRGFLDLDDLTDSKRLLKDLEQLDFLDFFDNRNIRDLRDFYNGINRKYFSVLRGLIDDSLLDIENKRLEDLLRGLDEIKVSRVYANINLIAHSDLLNLRDRLNVCDAASDSGTDSVPPTTVPPTTVPPTTVPPTTVPPLPTYNCIDDDEGVKRPFEVAVEQFREDLALFRAAQNGRNDQSLTEEQRQGHRENYNSAYDVKTKSAAAAIQVANERGFNLDSPDRLDESFLRKWDSTICE